MLEGIIWKIKHYEFYDIEMRMECEHGDSHRGGEKNDKLYEMRVVVCLNKTSCDLLI